VQEKTSAGIVEPRPGLFRWTARHPAWVADAEPESSEDWPPEVGCVGYEARGALVLIDPLIPTDREDELWGELDERAARCFGRVAVLTTIEFHSRSREAVVERYGPTPGGITPPGVELVPIRWADERMVWIEEHGALVPGDRLLGDGNGGLRLCPQSWLRYLDAGMTLYELRIALAPLVELPVEMVLVSHGEPVLSDGREAIRRVLT